MNRASNESIAKLVEDNVILVWLALMLVFGAISAPFGGGDHMSSLGQTTGLICCRSTTSRLRNSDGAPNNRK